MSACPGSTVVLPSCLSTSLHLQMPLLVLTSRIPLDAIATFIEQLLSSQPSLADGVATHKVLRLPDCTSTAFTEVLSKGLQWLASKAPYPPELQVSTCPSWLYLARILNAPW